MTEKKKYMISRMIITGFFMFIAIMIILFIREVDARYIMPIPVIVYGLSYITEIFSKKIITLGNQYKCKQKRYWYFRIFATMIIAVFFLIAAINLFILIPYMNVVNNWVWIKRLLFFICVLCGEGFIGLFFFILWGQIAIILLLTHFKKN